MSLEPKGEKLRKAVRWISNERESDPGAALYKLIEQACLKFDLSPKESEFLMLFFAEQKGAKQD
jgi:hypothetical protein